MFPRICGAYAPKPTGKTVRLPVGYSPEKPLVGNGNVATS